VRLLDTMIPVYFSKAGLLDALLQLPDLAVTTSVQNEPHGWPEASQAVEAAVAAGSLSVCDIDPMSQTERMLYTMYRDGDGVLGLGEGEATSMALAHSRGFTFVTHDRDARKRATSAGMRLLDWRDLLTELNDSGVLTAEQRKSAERGIRSLLKEQ
jgi:predicted nucleic acid-binding protein